jgi:arylsulfatase A-like enzyme
MRYSRNMSRDEVREKVIPTYMGLIKQIDDQMGVLMRFLEERGLTDTTMIVFTSDHGDYLAITGWARRTCSTSSRQKSR